MAKNEEFTGLQKAAILLITLETGAVSRYL